MSEYVIIGGSAAGISSCEAIRENDKKGKITLISDEKLALYSRCLLTYYIAGKIGREKILFKNNDFYSTHAVDAMHGVKAASIDVKKKIVSLGDGKTVPYGKLLIATGSSSKKIGIPGEDKKGVFGLRNIDDADGIVSCIDKVDTAVILGGGLIGLRDAYALRLKGKKVKIIVKSPYILSQMLDKDAADILEARLTEEGIEIMKGLDAKEITGSGSVSGVTLDNGTRLSCQLVIVGKGVAPNTDIAKTAGVKIEDGIIADNHLLTSIKDIYAAGDVAQTRDIATGSPKINAIWPAAVEQGRSAGRNMSDKECAYDGSGMMNSIDFFGLSTISIGLTKTKDPRCEELVSIDKDKKIYKKVIIRDNILLGAILVNKVANAGVYGIMIRKGIDVSSLKEKLLSDNFDYAKILPLVKKNPDKFSADEFRETAMTL